MRKYLLNKEFDPALKLLLSSHEDVAQNIFQFYKQMPATFLENIDKAKSEGAVFKAEMNDAIWEMYYEEKLESISFKKIPLSDENMFSQLFISSVSSEEIKNLKVNGDYYVGTFGRVIEYENEYTDDVLKSSNKNIESFDYYIEKKKELFKPEHLQLMLEDFSYIYTKIEKLKKPVRINPEKIWGNDVINVIDDPDSFLKMV